MTSLGFTGWWLPWVLSRQEGVVFVLSGFVNPERSTLRSQALEMGAKYQPDWNSDCTLLVCAFPNTPKFQQVEADNGTIISKVFSLANRMICYSLTVEFLMLMNAMFMCCS